MLKKYRHRFIALNMGLIGLVMIITFTVIGTEICRNDYIELKNVMSMVLKPWNLSEGENPPSDKKQTSKKNDDKKDSPPQHKTNARKERYKDDNITTIFYNNKQDKISVLSETISFEGNVDLVVHKIVNEQENFGILNAEGVIYYKETTGNTYKIAITDIWYLQSRILKIILILSLSLILSMIVILLISIKLSRLAAKPMENAIAMERQFVSDISHDLKTPITVILANNSILLSNPQSIINDNRQWLDSTELSAREMMDMVSQMLTLSSLESVENTVTKQSVNLSSVAEKCILQLESLAYENDVLIEENIEKDIFILSDEEYAKRICSSLVENALKYEPERGKLQICVSSTKKKALFSVRNFGSYISPEDLPHIFDRFYRGDKTRNYKKGHGLGLTIIKRMTELIDAKIQVNSSEKIGTIFTVIFDIT